MGGASLSFGDAVSARLIEPLLEFGAGAVGDSPGALAVGGDGRACEGVGGDLFPQKGHEEMQRSLGGEAFAVVAEKAGGKGAVQGVGGSGVGLETVFATLIDFPDGRNEVVVGDILLTIE